MRGGGRGLYQLRRRRVQRTPPQVAELTDGAVRTEEDDFVSSVVIRINEVPLPAASFGVRATTTFDARKISRGHAQDHFENDRSRLLAGRDRVTARGGESPVRRRFVRT